MTRLRLFPATIALALAVATFLTTPQIARSLANEKIIIVGDSISQGSSGDFTWRHRLWQGITQVRADGVSLVGPRTDLYDNVRSTSGSQYYAAAFAQKAHAATWGSSFADENPRVSGRVAAAGATVAIVQLGTNDLSYSLTPVQAVAAADRMVTELRAGNPSIKIVIGEVPHTYNHYTEEYSLIAQGTEYASGVRAMATRRSSSASPIVVAGTRSGWDAAFHAYDGTHPNPSGEAILANAYLRSLAQLNVIPNAPTLNTSISWPVRGPAPTLTPSTESLKVSWSRVSTGASAMYIRYRGSEWNDWQELPYPVGGQYGDSWTLGPIAGGETYDVQLKPNKYMMTGVYGGSTRSYVPGLTPSAATNVTATPVRSDTSDSTYGLNVSWTPGDLATGHYIQYGYVFNPGQAITWQGLPYPTTGSSWKLMGLKHGHYTRVGIESVRGLVRGPVAYAPTTRVYGVASNAVQVWIGDSYISGTGVPPYDDDCQRSRNAWPNLVLQAWTYRAYNLACGGSTMDQMVAPAGGSKHTGQLELMTAILKGATNNVSPRRIYVSISGNDMNFDDKLATCALSSCAGLESQWNQEIDALQPEINSTLAKVRAAAPYADIYLLGYPSIVDLNVDPRMPPVCATLSQEGGVVERVTFRLNSALQNGADRSSARIWANTVSAQARFAGKEWCNGGAETWINYPQGEWPDFWNIEPWTAHPNGTGTYHQAVTASEYVVRRLTSVTWRRVGMARAADLR
jgi:lysophospholipase L1-like esterase